MKNKLVSLIISAGIIISCVGCSSAINTEYFMDTYRANATVFKVEELDSGCYTVFLAENGHVFGFYGEGFEEGESVRILFDGNRTEGVEDDAILDVEKCQDPGSAGSSYVSPFLAASRGFSAGCSSKKSRKIYPDCGIITKIKKSKVFVTVQNGNVFSFTTEDGDWNVGDLVAMILDDNGTELVRDDKVLKVKYSGWISKKEYKVWVK